MKQAAAMMVVGLSLACGKSDRLKAAEAFEAAACACHERACFDAAAAAYEEAEERAKGFERDAETIERVERAAYACGARLNP